MAGGVLKGFGGVFLALGILLLLAGIASAAFAAYDQQENQDQSGPLGVAEDRDRSDQNEALLYGGAVAAAFGLVLLILGIVLLATGGSRARRAQRQALAGAMADAVPPSAVASGTTRAVDATADLPAPVNGPRRAVAVALTVAAVVLTLVIAGLVGLRGADGGLLGPGSPEGTRSVGEEHKGGHMPATFTVLGMSQSSGTSAVPLAPPSEAARAVVVLDWTPDDLGAATLNVELQVDAGGTWTTLAEATGEPGLTLDYAGPEVAGASMRVIVFVGGNGAAQGQDFQVDAYYFS